MKYSKSNPPMTCMMTQSTCYKGTKKMTVKGVLWHSTVNPTYVGMDREGQECRTYSSP